MRLDETRGVSLQAGRQRRVGLLFLMSDAGLVAHILVGLPLG